MSIWIQEQTGDLDDNRAKVTAEEISRSNVSPQFYRSADAEETVTDCGDQHRLQCWGKSAWEVATDVHRTNENKKHSLTTVRESRLFRTQSKAKK